MNPVVVVIIIFWACFQILRLAFGLLIVLVGTIIDHPKVMLPIIGIPLLLGIGVAVAGSMTTPSQPAPASPKAASSPSPASPNSSSVRVSNSQQQRDSSSDSDTVMSVENLLRDHYAAIGAARDFDKAYSNFSSTFQHQHSKQDWINDMKSLRINGITVNSVKVNKVSENKATAAVDYTSTLDYALPNGRNNVRQLDTLKNIVKENGQWKLDDQISHQVIG